MASPTTQKPTTPDPFVAMGGGVYVNGGWVPKNHPLAAQATLPQDETSSSAGAPQVSAPSQPLPPSPPSPQPAPQAAPAQAPPAPSPVASPPTTPDPFAAMGGGVQVNGGWVPKNHPLATSAPSAPTTLAPAGPAAPPVLLPTAGATSVNVTGGAGSSGLSTSNGQTTGTAPSVPLGATAPTDPVTSSMRQAVLSLLGQDVNQASVTDPDLAPQASAYQAARERAARQQRNAIIERLGTAGAASSGAADVALQRNADTAGQDTAAYNASLVGEKLEQRKQLLQSAIQTAASLGMTQEAQNLQRQLANLSAQQATLGLGQSAQGQQLQMQLANLDTQTKTYLANLDAQLRREGYGTTERLAQMDSALRRYGIDVQGNLGLLQAVISLMGMDQQNTQFNQQLGATLGMFGSNFNNGLITSLLNG